MSSMDDFIRRLLTDRNKRVRVRYDELMAEGKHGHYETMFRVVREECETEREACAAYVGKFEPDLAAGIRAGEHVKTV